MARHTPYRPGSLLFALLLAFSLLAPHSLSPTAQAQGSRTFPETGKTVTGTFLRYWDSHGGLAQQGFPISQQIQETSDTNGKIYHVQYFERAVFEFHPENAGKPSEVLLSLLGTFLYRQKYPQGAPNTTPNNEPGSRLYSETGKRLGGIFLRYWDSHGGLAQQGFPISDEFIELSDLDGKSYKVQYFERAVFEYHPENRPPFDVLLSQLGTFRYRQEYGTLTTQLSGSGNQPSVPFTLKAGLALLQGVRADEGGYFYIDLVNPAGEKIATPASGSGPLDLSYAVMIPADGTYALQVQSEGGWTVNVSQPKAAYAPPPAEQRFSGRFSQATPLFSLKAGAVTFHAASANNKEVFRMNVLNQNGEWVADIANTTGPADITEAGEVPADGIYVVQVISDGDWTLEIRQ
jgi:hypothetical protein